MNLWSNQSLAALLLVFDPCDTGDCSSAVYRLPGGLSSCRGRGRRRRSVNAQTRKAGQAGGVGSVNAQTRKAGEAGGVGSVNAQTSKAESEGGGVGSVNAQTCKAEALAQMPCVENK